MPILRPVPGHYTGLVTRALALAIDALIISVVAVVTGAVVALILGVLHVPSTVETIVAALGGLASFLWAAAYFTFFWSTTGQTPGAHVMQFSVRGQSTSEPLGVGKSIVRFIGLILAAIPLFAGFLPVLFDRRRRGFQDWLAGSVVVDTEEMIQEMRAARVPRRLGAPPPPA